MLAAAVPSDEPLPLARRISDLLGEARCAARQHVGELDQALARVVALAGDVADGGAAYPVGIRALCRHLTTTAGSQQRALRGFQPISS